jgi:cell division protein FtsW (lipid II flippase)
MPRLILIAVPTLAASVVVLAIAQVGPAVWTQQAVAVVLAAAVAVAGRRWVRRGATFPTWAVIGLALAGLAATLLWGETPPRRWLAVGPLRLYMAPVVLPVLLLAHGVEARGGRERATAANAALVIAGVLLAMQPDASQVVALLVAVVAGATVSLPVRRAGLAMGALLTLLTAWAFTRPDPLQPIPHVEGVFALALAHSVAAGAAVVAAAATFILSLWARADRGLAAYYAALFACSMAGLTPAALIGYGAGPWLGYGLMAGLARRLSPQPLEEQAAEVGRGVPPRR